MRVIYLQLALDLYPGGEDRFFSLKARYTFKLMEEITGAIRLAAESSDIFTVSVNGNIVKPTIPPTRIGPSRYTI